jgi:hypothetical protein
MTTRWLDTAYLAALCAVVFAQAWISLRDKSLTFDEVTYIPSGYSYVVTGDYRLNPEHPPLAKLLAGAALLPLGPRLDLTQPAWETHDQWTFGRRFFERSDVSVSRLVGVARLPTVLVLMTLVVGAFALARELYGAGPAYLAAWLCAFSPNLLAHGRLATNDLAHTAFVLFTLLAFVHLWKRPTVGRTALAGVVLGLALLTKFTAILLVGLLPLAGLTMAWAKSVQVPGFDRLTAIRDVRRRGAVWVLGSTAITSVLALLVVTLGYGSPGDPRAFLGGLAALYTNVNVGNPTYFAGTFHSGGVPYYFLAVLLLKTPTAALALLALRAVDLLARRDFELRPAVVLLMPACAWLVVMTLGAYQYGVRYILPAYPLLFIYASGLVRSPILRHRWSVAAVGLLALAFAAGSVRAHPHYIPYFNLLAGGPDRGIEWLDDSNVDWGQDLPLLARYLEDADITDATVAPMTWYDPGLYGVSGTVVGPSAIIAYLTDPAPPPGVYAASAHLLTRARYGDGAPVDPLTDLEPTAILGHSIYVFDLRR